MKRNLWKKLIALSLATCMVFSLAACGSSSSSSDSSDTGSASVTEDAAVEEAAEGEETAESAGAVDYNGLEFSFFAPIWSPYTEESDIIDELQARTGVTMDIEWVQEDAFTTQLSARVASHDLPDVIMTLGDLDAADLAKDGVIVPITDYIEEYMPNFCALLDDEDWVYLREASDGEIYSFGLVMDVPGSFTTMIRKDWLDDLGMDVPETWDEWKEVWYAFRDEDANGDGDPTNEIPFAIADSTFYFIENIFGIEADMSANFAVVDGVYTYVPEMPEYQQMLEEMAVLYADGVFDQEFVTRDTTALNTAGSNNTLGSAVYYAEQTKNYTLAASDIDEDALFISVEPIIGPNGTQIIPARNKVSDGAYITQAAVESGKVEQILSFFDYIYSDEGILLTNFGIEGTHFEYVDGVPTLQAPYNESFVEARTDGLIPSTIPFCFTNDVYLQILMGGVAYEDLEPGGQSFVDGFTINEPYFYSMPPTLTTNACVEHADLMEQQVSLRDRCIMGQITLDEYNEEYQKLKDAGLNDVISEVADAYAAIN